MKPQDVVEAVRLLGIDAPETGIDEFAMVLDLSVDSHIASSTKHRTGIFDGQYLTPSEETGKRLFAWLNSGADPKGELLQQIESLIRQLNLGEFQNAYWL